eukprot:scaffold34804_cov58-Phaeocystis_antarctica.AAC.3
MLQVTAPIATALPPPRARQEAPKGPERLVGVAPADRALVQRVERRAPQVGEETSHAAGPRWSKAVTWEQAAGTLP